MRIKRWKQIAGHDFYWDILDNGGTKRSERSRGKRAGTLGIVCYNCGTWTSSPDAVKLVGFHLEQDSLMQCPSFHCDLFGGRIWMGKQGVMNMPRARRKKS